MTNKKMDKKIQEMFAKEIAETIEYRMWKILNDTPRKQKLRKLLGITDEQYFTKSSEK